MEVTRQHVLEVLRKAGLGQQAEQLIASLPDDPIDLDRVVALLLPYGITRDELISRMGGSP